MLKLIISKKALFFTALLQVTFVAMNVTYIANHKIIPMLITGFLISLCWSLNVSKVAIGSWTDRIIYSTGAMCGTGLGYIISNFLSNIL